jgi:hypothetical protein
MHDTYPVGVDPKSERQSSVNTAHNKSRLAERRAVNASRSFFEENGLIFQEIDLRNDIGKDAVLDLARSGDDAGLTVALQIKGGQKYKRKDGHSIPIDARLRNIWRNSSLPIFVIVLDPDDEQLYWGNLTEMAKTASGGIGTVPVSPNTRLTPDGLDLFLEIARLECSARRGDSLLDLISADPGLLQSALFDCLALGRRDPRYLTLVRCSLPFIQDQRSFYTAITLLAHATPHPDILWHPQNYIPDAVAEEICKSFRWTPSDIAMLLARLCLPEAGMWTRGTIGQTLYMLLREDKALRWSIDQLLTEAFREQELTWRSCWVKGPPFGPEWVRTDRETVILPSLTLALELAADPKERLDELTERLPSIRLLEWFTEIEESVTGDWFGVF